MQLKTLDWKDRRDILEKMIQEFGRPLALQPPQDFNSALITLLNIECNLNCKQLILKVMGAMCVNI